ncbi:hypothetical protein J2S47_001386 [Streptomyces griseoviridis]|uniref:Transposase n=1 Tax=Streptomyces griseoviridis TaxID=45398 RepID=A0ABT9LB43_STRGD|nr:hypothetical protein [Streptomyces griseoviridis]
MCRPRQDRGLGPARPGPILNPPASTVHRILVRHGLNRLADMDRPTGQVIRRYERARPGELVHVDVKKLGRIPDGGGHKVLGRQAGRARRGSMGFDHIHSAVDATPVSPTAGSTRTRRPPPARTSRAGPQPSSRPRASAASSGS